MTLLEIIAVCMTVYYSLERYFEYKERELRACCPKCGDR